MFNPTLHRCWEALAHENKLQNTSFVSVIYLQCKVLTSMLRVLLGTLWFDYCTEPANVILQSAQLINPASLFSIMQFACYICQICFWAPLNISLKSFHVFMFEGWKDFCREFSYCMEPHLFEFIWDKWTNPLHAHCDCLLAQSISPINCFLINQYFSPCQPNEHVASYGTGDYTSRAESKIRDTFPLFRLAHEMISNILLWSKMHLFLASCFSQPLLSL